MSRRKGKYSDREYDDLQRLKHENKKLKRQVSALRKQISRLDLDRYENLKDIVQKHYEAEEQDQFKKDLKKLKKEWECHVCREGFLKLYLINRRNEVVYYRKCTECDNRTSVKPYNSKVEGIKDEEID